MKSTMRDHFVICNWNDLGDQIIRQLHAKVVGDERPVVIVTDQPEHVPQCEPELSDDPYRNVFVIPGDPTSDRILARANIAEADTAIVLSDPREGEHADTKSVLTALAIEATEPRVHTIVELLHSRNRVHFQHTSVDEVVCVDELTEKLVAQAALTHGLSEFYCRLLTATESQAEDLGLSDGFADSFEQVLALTGLTGAKVVEPSLTWAEQVARFLTHPIVSSALMTIGMLGIIIEFYTPGIGFAGFIGAFALFLFFAGHLAVHLAGLEEIILFFIGIALLIVEFFFIPGFGFIGLAGGLAVAASLILALIGIDLRIAWDVGLVADAFMKFGLAIVLTGTGFALIIRFLPSLGPVKSLILNQSLKDNEGYIASDPSQRTELPGTTGTAVTDLRPGGKALLNGVKLDVVAQNEYIRKGETIKVLSADGPRITVERIESAGEDEPDV